MRIYFSNKKYDFYVLGELELLDQNCIKNMKVYFYENECDKWYVAHIVGIRFAYDPFVLSVCFVIRHCSLDKWVFYFFKFFFLIL